MIKRALIFSLLGCFAISGTVLASDSVPATLAISGEILSSASCSVSLSSNVMALDDATIGSLTSQGQNINRDTTDSVGILFSGEGCKYAKGYKLIGSADKTGTALVNSLASETSAKGVGIGVYQFAGAPVTFNSAVYPIASEYDGTYPLYFKMVKLYGEEQTPGPVQASLTVEVESL